jgi:hypothetical protein
MSFAFRGDYCIRPIGCENRCKRSMKHAQIISSQDVSNIPCATTCNKVILFAFPFWSSLVRFDLHALLCSFQRSFRFPHRLWINSVEPGIPVRMSLRIRVFCEQVHRERGIISVTREAMAHEGGAGVLLLRLGGAHDVGLLALGYDLLVVRDVARNVIVDLVDDDIR